jgi:hypothetical protein
MTVTPGEAIANDPHDVELVHPNGTRFRVPVRYTFRGLRDLERRHDNLQWVIDNLTRGLDGKLFELVVSVLAGGLQGVTVPPSPGVPRDGAPLWNPDVLVDLMDPALISDYAMVGMGALQQALPQGTKAEADAEDPTQAGSPGPSGTTSGPSSSDAPTTSSGE